MAIPQRPSSVVGANVRAELARRRLSQSDLAAHLGVSQTAISKRLSGEVAWDINELSTVAAFFGLTVEQLVADPIEHVA